jgi:hypothetical protein
MIIGEPVAEPMWDREHPLSHGHVGREHSIHQVRGALGHAPPATARTEAAAFARKRQQPLERAVPAAHAREAVRQHPTPEILLELGKDERRQPHPLGLCVERRHEGGEMRPHDAVEHAGRRRARHVDPAHAADR